MRPIHRTALLALLITSSALALPARQESVHAQKLALSDGKTDANTSEIGGLTEASQFTFVLTEHQGTKVSTTQCFADGAKFRLEPQESKTADHPEGMYAVSLDGGHTTYLVNPAERQFTRVDAEALKAKALEKLSALNKQTGLQIDSPKVETVLTEPGETLDGHATRHYKLRISYSMHFLKNNASRSYVEYQDLWMASDIERKGAPDILIYFRPTGDARIDGAWERELAQIPGFPLQQVTLRTEVNEEGNSSVLRLSREITDVRTAPVPASLFVLPTGYKEVAGQEEIR